MKFLTLLIFSTLSFSLSAYVSVNKQCKDFLEERARVHFEASIHSDGSGLYSVTAYMGYRYPIIIIEQGKARFKTAAQLKYDDQKRCELVSSGLSDFKELRYDDEIED